MDLIISVISWLVICYLGCNVIYLFIFALAGRAGQGGDGSKPGTGTITDLRRIAVLIPAYREDAVIGSSVAANLRQTYPADRYDLIVIADSMQPDTLRKLLALPVIVLPVSFEQSTVQKSILFALNSLPTHQYEIVLISDADNHMAPDFLAQINQAFGQGWQAVQGHRVAKNLNTSMAVFDAMNEEVSNTIFRAGQRVLGFSASLIGSGMAFEPALMKQALSRLQTVGGYDKELEMLLAVKGVRIGYLPDAFIYDEKVQDIAVFQKQRTRWIAAQLYFVRAYFTLGIDQLLKGNDQAFNILIRALLLPRMILLGILGGLVPVSFFCGNGLSFWCVTGLLITLLVSLGVAVPGALWRKVSVRDFLILPSLIVSMFRSLLAYRQAGKTFLHTPHTETADAP